MRFARAGEHALFPLFLKHINAEFMNWKHQLGEFFSSAVNQESIEYAAEIMADVSKDDPEYHTICIETLRSAIASCERGEKFAISEIQKSGYRVVTPEEARTLLTAFLYLHKTEYAKRIT